MVGSGFVSSLGRPGGRVTGLSSLAPEIGGKQIDVLRQIIPTLSRVAIVGDSREPGYAIQTSYLDVGSARNAEALFEKLRAERPDARVVMPTPSAVVTSGRHAFEPFKFDLVINLKAAKESGIEIPMSLLARADRVIH